jgi:hypothetical protein
MKTNFICLFVRPLFSLQIPKLVVRFKMGMDEPEITLTAYRDQVTGKPAKPGTGAWGYPTLRPRLLIDAQGHLK